MRSIYSELVKVFTDVTQRLWVNNVHKKGKTNRLRYNPINSPKESSEILHCVIKIDSMAPIPDFLLRLKILHN
jgi:hypothetical protein